MSNVSLVDIRLEIKEVNKILISTHLRPDGDAIGSLLGLGLSLEKAGKQVEMVSLDGVPMTYKFLPGCDKITDKALGEHDFSIVVDCSDIQRNGGSIAVIDKPDLNIDHHITNLEYARLNWIEPKAVATAEVLSNILPSLELPMTPDVATALLTGIVADTLGFRTSNMTPDALRVTAMLMEAGANLPVLYQHILFRRSFNSLRLWGLGLSNINRRDGLFWVTISSADRENVGYPGKDDADLVNMLTAIQEAEIVVVFVEQPGGKVKISWRGLNDHDVAKLAMRYNGGGHRAAAGAMLSGSLSDVSAEIIEETYRQLYGSHALL